MTHNVNLTPCAKADLHNIWRYTVDTWSEVQADKYVRAVLDRCEWLATQPRIGKHRPDVAPDYYCFVQGQHVIFYLIRESTIDIIGIPHRQMDIVQFFDE